MEMKSGTNGGMISVKNHMRGKRMLHESVQYIEQLFQQQVVWLTKQTFQSTKKR